MSSRLHTVLCILATLVPLIVADTLPTSPGPFVSCSGIAVSSCPTTSGCCFAGACCGSGCCAATEMCVFPNSPQAGCCRFDDPTLCGSLTVTSSSPSPAGTDSPSNDPVPDPNCTRIRNCVNYEGSWTCLLGRPCGFFKGDCGTCPALLASSSVPPSDSDSTSMSNSLSTSSPEGSTTTGSISSTGSSTGSSSSVSSSGHDMPLSSYAGLGWKSLVALVPAYVLAV